MTIQAVIEAVEQNLRRAITIEGKTNTALHLDKQMQTLLVPGVSISVIDNGCLAWEKGYGQKSIHKPDLVSPDTLFQACSISKAVTSLGAMALVERGFLDLDEDVNNLLKSWQIPENEFTVHNKVTLRLLLSHGAGTSVIGLPGHLRGQPVPDIREILDGLPPANTAPVRVIMQPGSRFNYSGGGYTIIQLLMMDVTHQPFDVLMKDLVLDPLGMHRSTFLQPLSSARWMEAASGHDVAGNGMEGDWHVFPALAAAGLWTTSSDIARFVMGVQQAWHGLSNQVVSLETARLMTTPQFPHWGLGPGIGGQGEGEYFYHSGGNLGFRCEMIGFLHRDQGAVVMTNSDNGTDLCMQILRSIGEVYNWPACRSKLQKTIALSSSLANKYAGVYRSLDDPDRLAQITFQNESLFIEVPGFFPPKFGIFPETENEFFSEEHGFRFKFIENDNELICEATILDMKYRSMKVRTSSNENLGGNHV